jgi:hypothetical protein
MRRRTHERFGYRRLTVHGPLASRAPRELPERSIPDFPDADIEADGFAELIENVRRAAGSPEMKRSMGCGAPVIGRTENYAIHAKTIIPPPEEQSLRKAGA